jgi:hypothetical protein
MPNLFSSKKTTTAAAQPTVQTTQVVATPVAQEPTYEQLQLQYQAVIQQMVTVQQQLISLQSSMVNLQDMMTLHNKLMESFASSLPNKGRANTDK